MENNNNFIDNNNNFYVPILDKTVLLSALNEIKQFNKKQQDIFIKFENDKMLIIADNEKEGQGTWFKLKTIKFDSKRLTSLSYSKVDKSDFYRVNLKHFIYFINEAETDYIQMLIILNKNSHFILEINNEYLLKGFIPRYEEIGPSGYSYSSMMFNHLNYIVKHPELSK